MTVLEIILIAVVWIAYGVFSAYQSNDNTFEDVDTFEVMIGIAISPIILIVRVLLGVFHKCTMQL